MLDNTTKDVAVADVILYVMSKAIFYAMILFFIMIPALMIMLAI